MISSGEMRPTQLERDREETATLYRYQAYTIDVLMARDALRSWGKKIA